MRVLIISLEFFPVENGITISLDRISKNLAKLGHEIHILTFGKVGDNKLFNSKTNILSDKKSENLFVYRISPFSGNVQYTSPQELQDMVFYGQMLDKKHDFDVIHGFRLTPAGYIATLLGKLLGKKTVVSVRGNDIGRNVYDINLFAMNKYVIENADRLTFVASDLMDLANAVVPLGGRGRVINNSFDVSKYVYLEDLPKLNLKGRVIGTSGIIRRKKGFVYMIEAFAKYSEKNEATFFLVGDFRAEEKEYYEGLLEKYKIKSKFVKTGVINHKNVLNYMKYLDVFLLPSLSEGCANSMLEAMYLKKPIIATDLGGAKDILVDGESGLMVSARNSEEIYDALLKVDIFGNDIVKNAFEKITVDLAPEKETKAFVDVYGVLVK